MKWISTKERLPEEGQEVLYIDYEEDKVVNYGLYNDEWFNYSEAKNVPYWMPLPAPPSEEEKAEEVWKEKEFKVGMKVRVVKHLFDRWEYGKLGRNFNNPIGTAIEVNRMSKDGSYRDICQKYNVPFKRFVKAGGWDFHPDELEIIE